MGPKVGVQRKSHFWVPCFGLFVETIPGRSRSMDQLEASGHFDSSERCEIGHARCPGLFRPLSTIYATEWGCTQDLGLLGKKVRSNFFLFNAAGDAFRCGEIPLKMPFLIWTMGEKESGMLFPNEMGNLRAPELFFLGKCWWSLFMTVFRPFFCPDSFCGVPVSPCENGWGYATQFIDELNKSEFKNDLDHQ